MKTALFDFVLPNSLIATQPVCPRDSAKMLVLASDVQDHCVSDLPRFLKPGDVVVFNDTRVIPARLFGKRGDAKIEILLHKCLSNMPSNNYASCNKNQPSHYAPGAIWQCFAKPAKKLRVGDKISFADDFHGIIIDKLTTGEVVLQFAESDISAKLIRYGHMPLPPYINRTAAQTDNQNYQTIYAKHNGAVAAPTAGLHFTQSLLTAIDSIGAKIVYITLHVGGGTFLPVKVEDTSQHVMHSEYAVVTSEVAFLINAAKNSGGRVVAVGTTSLRTLESATDEKGEVHAFAGETDIFITPGYQFKVVDILMTNFHLPKSTLFMLVAAFYGLDAIRKAYAHAIARHYRFYSYGDACLMVMS